MEEINERLDAIEAKLDMLIRYLADEDGLDGDEDGLERDPMTLL